LVGCHDRGEKLLVAYHEGGRAIVRLNVVAAGPIHKATIIPRGRALGMVMQLPERDKLSMSLEQMISRLTIMIGSRFAEELVFDYRYCCAGCFARGPQDVCPGILLRSCEPRFASALAFIDLPHTNCDLSRVPASMFYGSDCHYRICLSLCM
jgi:peptidase M41-like protein